MPIFRAGKASRRPQVGPDPDRAHHLAIATTVFVLMIGLGVGLGAKTAAGDEAPPVGEPPVSAPTLPQVEEALEEAGSEESPEGREAATEAAEELPHRDLDGSEALELAEGVFGAQLEATGIFGELEPERFLSDNVAVVPASSLGETPEPEAEGPGGSEAPGPVAPTGPVLIESTLPLRTRNAEGEEEAVDLTLLSPEGSGGELQPQNPLAEVTIPGHLGEGLSVGEVGIAVAGAPQETSPTNVEGRYAFYPNVAENTDLVVTPTPTGAETMTQIRSAEAPTATTYELTMPEGSELRPTTPGGAEVLDGGDTTLLVPPPSAIDAAGNPVRTELSVHGASITVKTTPDLSTTFPIMVDPIFLTETANWAVGHESMAGWTNSTSNSSATLPVPYWIWNSAYPGLDLSWGFGGNAKSGDTSSWSYTVPRYAEDASVGKTPSTWIYVWSAEDVLFSHGGSSAGWPALVWGITNPTGWVKSNVHTGSEPDWTTWPNAVSTVNEHSDGTAKSALMAMITGEAETPAKRRDAYFGVSNMVLVDEGAPVVKEFKEPTHWMDKTAGPITFAVEDTGLGVKSSWASFEGNPEKGWGFELPCIGANAGPCPRTVRSGTPGKDETQVALNYDPTILPTGKDQVAFAFGDPLWGLTGDGAHTTGASVTLKIDHKAPEVTLSGALTEEEKLGTLKSEYPLTISATDGNVNEPQSGIAKVEVKVDGKKVTMSNESAWNPSCATENCSFTGTWTLKTSEYTAASHEVEVLVTDAAGVVTSETVGIDLGEAPPQTSFTSPHPSFEQDEVHTIGFKATRGGAAVTGATFKCKLDEAAWTPCTSPDPLPDHLDPGHHQFEVAASAGGKTDPTPAVWDFTIGIYPPAPPAEKLVYPEIGDKSADYYTLEAEWGPDPEGKAGQGVTGITFEVTVGPYEIEKNPPEHTLAEVIPAQFQQVPAECVIDGQGRPVSWPIPVHAHPGHSAPVYFKVRGCPLFAENDFPKGGYPEQEIRFRAAFDGGPAVAGVSQSVSTEFAYRANGNRVPTDATQSIGPATVDMLTGAFALNHTDVSIPVPGYETNLEFTRSYSSSPNFDLPGYSKVLGGGWQPSLPLESEYEGEAWSKIVEREIPAHPVVMETECWPEWEEDGEGHRLNEHQECAEVEVEGAQLREAWIELVDNEEGGIPFEIADENLVSPEYAKELSLKREGQNIILSYPNGNRTTFEKVSGLQEWVPKAISFQLGSGKSRMVYQTNGKGLRLWKEIAPAPVECPEEAMKVAGCRMLEFHYSPFGQPAGSTELLRSIEYFGPSGGGVGVPVAEYAYAEPAPGKKMLASEKDPRLPSLIEGYGYESANPTLIASVTPPGQSPWTFGYRQEGSGGPTMLKTVSRAGMTTTLAYGVPTHGSAAPYAMGSEDIAKWGQTDLPADATAIFPPNHVPSEYPPHAYTGATIHYMDPEGHEVNTASPSPPGVTGATITTTETDMKGNVVRELDPQNRLIALEAGAASATRSHELDSHSIYNAAGTEMLESWGPLHMVRLEGTSEVQAREHTTTRYDEGEPTPPAGTPPAYLPTKETVAAVIPGKEGEFEPRVTETKYEWKHRLPEETIVDPGTGGLNIRTITKYNEVTGQVVETRQPKGAEQFQASEKKTAGDTRTIYYSATVAQGECPISVTYANLPCEVLPAVNESGPGRSQLPVKKFTAYNYLGEPTSMIEYPQNEPAQFRKTVTEYDEAGRVKSTMIVGGGISLARTEARTETVYSPTLGLPIEQKFVCEPEHQCTAINPEATKTEYNKLGQVTEYEDADGAKSKTSYDAYGRPVTITDEKGKQTLHYDETSGVLTSMDVSEVGTFTAAYDADGDLVRRGLPNGLTAATTYNQAGEPMKLTYTKSPETYCGGSCTWYEESLERSIEGRILYGASSLVKNQYRYDKAGRLEEAQETPAKNLPEEGKCTSRVYKYDADSNRLTKTTHSPGVGGACATSGGATESYSYDEADRLEGPTYDAWGRITTLPGKFAGGKELKTAYFANDMVATQEQNGVSNTFQLDSTGRQRQREQAGGVAGVEIFHYDGPGDSPSWTSLGKTWSRNISGIGGELAAIQESNGTTTTTFKLTDLHGDAVASASASPTATNLLATYRSDEFGEPELGSAGRFGWLGGKSRRTEFTSGAIQMGARSYIPQLGRFLSPDSVTGGSANAYDYVDQDPVNGFDLEGTCSRKKHCAASHQRAQATKRTTARTTTARVITRRSTKMHGPPAPGVVQTFKPPRLPGNGPCPGPKCLGGPHHPTVPTFTEGGSSTAHSPVWTLCQRYPFLNCPEGPDKEGEEPVGGEGGEGGEGPAD